jgi:hypothetical protein
MSSKVNKWKEEALAHYGLIKYLLCVVIEREFVRVPWEEFVTMDIHKFLASEQSI